MPVTTTKALLLLVSSLGSILGFHFDLDPPHKVLDGTFLTFRCWTPRLTGLWALRFSLNLPDSFELLWRLDGSTPFILKSGYPDRIQELPSKHGALFINRSYEGYGFQLVMRATWVMHGTNATCEGLHFGSDKRTLFHRILRIQPAVNISAEPKDLSEFSFLSAKCWASRETSDAILELRFQLEGKKFSMFCKDYSTDRTSRETSCSWNWMATRSADKATVQCFAVKNDFTYLSKKLRLSVTPTKQNITVLKVEDHVCERGTRYIRIPITERDWTVKEIVKILQKDICLKIQALRRQQGSISKEEPVFLISLFDKEDVYALRNGSILRGEPADRAWKDLDEEEAFPLVWHQINVVDVYNLGNPPRSSKQNF